VKNSKTHPLGLSGDNGSKLIPSVKQIRKYSKTSKLFQRAFRKISPEYLLVALLASVSFAERSSRAIALELGICGDINVSRKAVWDRLKNPAIVAFLQLIIEYVMEASTADNELLECRKNWLESKGQETVSRIKRVLIGDASTFTLHPSLANIFPGSKNQTDVPKAHLKLQLITDLLTGKWVHFSFDAYGRSDMKAALDFMPSLEAGDLLIRDLGYACMASFQAIIDADAFFISRLKSSFQVFDREGKRIPLRKTLQRLAPNPGDVVRLPIMMTRSNGVKCILVAQRCPQHVGNIRRRKRKEHNKAQGFNPPSKRTLQLQNWTILVTNLETEDADNEQIFQWYQMRWRIENIFKACKSHTSWLQVSHHKTNPNHAKALILSWFLTMVILADRGAFRMARLQTENQTNQSGPPDPYRLEFVNFSIIKSIGKLMNSFGHQLELAGSGFDCVEHHARMLRYMERHNKTELQLNRIALVEILELTVGDDRLT
jgi:hypothetical protein